MATTPSGELFVIHSMTSGMTMHRTEDGAQRKSYWDGIDGRMFIKQIAFAEHSKAIVSGGEEGAAYVFDRASARCVATLSHQPGGGLVQIVSVCVVQSFLYSMLINIRCMIIRWTALQ